MLAGLLKRYGALVGIATFLLTALVASIRSGAATEIKVDQALQASSKAEAIAREAKAAVDANDAADAKALALIAAEQQFTRDKVDDVKKATADMSKKLELVGENVAGMKALLQEQEQRRRRASAE